MRKISILILVSLLILSGYIGTLYFGAKTVAAETYISGDIVENIKWSKSNSPYILKSDVRVHKGATLTIEAGVTVKFDGLYSIVVDGSLNAKGTKTNTIKFTSNSTTPQKGDWYTLRLRTGNNVLSWAEIDYAKYGVFITYYGGNNIISNTTFKFCSVDGIYITNSNNNTIADCMCDSNNGYGITIYDSDHTMIRNVQIKSNNFFGIYLNASRYTYILNCNISDNNGKGVILYSNSYNTKIVNCELCNNNNIGIDCSGTNNNTIFNTDVKGNKGTGIDLGGPTTNQTIENCNIINNGNTGIDLRGSNNINILKCNISRNNGNGGIYSSNVVTQINISNSELWNNLAGNAIDFNAAISSKIINTEIKENVGTGILFGESPSFNDIINKCRIFKNTENGIFIKQHKYNGVSNIEISESDIFLNGQDGIHFNAQGWSGMIVNSNKIFKNNIYQNKQNGISFTTGACLCQANYNQIYDNIIYSNNQNGVYFYAYYHSTTNSNQIYRNSIIANGQNGIYFVTWGASTSTENNIFQNNISFNNYEGIFLETYQESSSNYKNTISNNIINSNNNGIHFYAHDPYYFANVNGNIIVNNTINNNEVSGIYLDAINDGEVKMHSIINCTILKNKIGINSRESTSNKILHNLIGHNVETGIYLTISSSNNNIKNNNITSNLISGIYITSNSNNNIFTNNDISTNLQVGLNVTDTTGQKIHHNNFKNNTMNAYDSTIALNNWDDGAQGNSWSDYTGTDDNRDGFGEDPYVIPGGGSRDWHPFIEFINFSYPKVLEISPPNLAENVPVNTNIKITFSKEMNTSWVVAATSISGGFSLMNPIWSDGNKIVTFQPNANLSFNTTYFVNITTLAQDAFGNSLLTDFSSQFTTGPPRVPTPPEVIDNYPTGSKIPINTEISITFNELMYHNSVELAFSISPTVDGTFSWSKTKMIFKPNNNLAYNKKYTVTITTAARDLEYDFLRSEFIWEFSTIMEPQPVPPRIISYSPTGSNVPVKTNVVITFSELMDRNSVESAFGILPDIEGVFSWNYATLTFTPSKDLLHYNQYTIIIDNIAKDLENEHLKSRFSWLFTTVPEKIPNPPSIILNSPTGIDVPIESEITVIFSESMNKKSVENAFSIKPTADGSFKWDNNILIFTPMQPLAYLTQYSITISTLAEDLEDENLGSDFTWEFITVKEIEHTPPYILDKSPTGIDVPISANITIIFSEPMDKGLTEKAFSISPNIVGSFNWVENTLIFIPDDILDYETVYSIQISTLAKDLEAENLGSDYLWRFTTVAIKIVNPVLDHVIITTAPTELKVGDNYQFSAKGFDDRDSEMDNLTFYWDIEGGIGTIDALGYFTAIKPGNGTITVLSGGKTAKVNISIAAIEPEKDGAEVQEKNIESADIPWSWLLIIIVFLVTVFVLVFVYVVVKRKKKGVIKAEPEQNAQPQPVSVSTLTQNKGKDPQVTQPAPIQPKMQSQQLNSKKCSSCGYELKYYQQNNRYYCHNCERYA